MIKQTIGELKNVSEKKVTDFEDFQKLSEYLSKFLTDQSRSGAEGLDKDSYNLLEDSDGIQLYYIDARTSKGQRALDTLGKGAKWCVLSKSAGGSGLFDHYRPHAYYMFVVDGRPEALLHENSEQLKDAHDRSITNGMLIKRIAPFIEKHNLVPSKRSAWGDFRVYRDTLQKVKDMGEKVDDKEFIDKQIKQDFKNFMLIPESHWPQYTEQFLKQMENPYSSWSFSHRDNLVDELDYKTLSYISNFVQIKKMKGSLETLEKDVISWLKDDVQNLTVGRYKKMIPSQLRTPTVNKEFNERREKEMNRWRGRIQEALRSVGDSLPRIEQCPFEEIINDPDTKEAYVKHWENKLLNHIAEYNTIFTEMKATYDDPRLDAAFVTGWANAIKDDDAYTDRNSMPPYMRDYSFDYDKMVPEELHDHPEIVAAEKERWVRKVVRNPLLNMEKCPEKIRYSDEIQQAYMSIEGWATVIKNDPKIYDRCPEELQKKPEILKARYEGWLDLFTEDNATFEDNYQRAPKDVRDSKRAKQARLTAWAVVVWRDISQYERCPKDIKNEKVVQENFLEGDASRYHAKIKSNPTDYFKFPKEIAKHPKVIEYIETFPKKSRDKLINWYDYLNRGTEEKTAGRLNSSSFNDNYIGKLS
jgi:hypothetical protein